MAGPVGEGLPPAHRALGCELRAAHTRQSRARCSHRPSGHAKRGAGLQPRPHGEGAAWGLAPGPWSARPGLQFHPGPLFPPCLTWGKSLKSTDGNGGAYPRGCGDPVGTREGVGAGPVTALGHGRRALCRARPRPRGPLAHAHILLPPLSSPRCTRTCTRTPQPRGHLESKREQAETLLWFLKSSVCCPDFAVVWKRPSASRAGCT